MNRNRTIFLCFLAVALDGFDTASIGFASPALAAQWGLAAAALTPAFVGTSLGAVAGFMAAGTLVARIGHRLLIILSIAWFAVFSLLTSFTESITTLTLLRFVTALGLGTAVPVAIALACEYSEPRRREVVATFVSMGFGVGVVIGGIVSKPLLAHYTWSSIFITGGLAPLALLPLFWFFLPDSQRAPSKEERPAVGQLLSEKRLGPTLLLWSFAFLIFMNTYMFTFWTPLLLTSFGFSASEAAIGPTAFGGGGLIGALIAIPLIARLGVMRVLICSSLLGAVAVAVLALVDLERSGILLALVSAGAGMAFGNIGLSAAAVALYPAELRPTGIGFASAVGRVGGILGPALAGALLYMELPVRQVILTACIPSVLAALAMLLLRLATVQRLGARTGAVPRIE